MGKRSYIGQRVVKMDAVERVSGEALFGADLKLTNMLYGRVLRSPHPHARIKGIDYTRALKLEGVKAVATAADLPPLEDAKAAFGGELYIDLDHLRKLVIAHDKALFQGHPVAAVAAISPEIAEEALELIDVDYELLSPVENALDAMRPDAPLLHENLITQTLGERPKKPSNIAAIIDVGYGDIEKGFKEADVVMESSYETQMVHQGYIEPLACAARAEADGKVTVWTTTQGSFNAQRQLSAILKIPLGKINLVPLEIGGGFGGKIYTLLEPLAVILSRKSGRPVKLVMTREEVLKATGPGSPGYMTVKTGAKKDGHLTACYAKIIYDGGAFPGAPVQGAAMVSFGPYKADSVKIEGYDVVTNKPRVQAYRAPGGTAIGFAVESQMDIMAEALGIDPLEFRKINAVSEGDLMPMGQKYNRIGLKKMIESIENHPAWINPLEGPNKGRGIAFGFWGGATLTSSSEVLVNVDGSVSVVTGQVDLTGIRTTMAQMVAEELQLPIEVVEVRVCDTESSIYTDLSAGSRSTYTQSVALYRASLDVLRQMKSLAAEQLKVDVGEVEYGDGIFRAKSNNRDTVTWRQVAMLSRNRGEGPVCGKGVVTRLQSAPAFAAHIADVDVDPETGKVRILRYTCFQDVGRAINPAQVEGQMQGGAVQGIGWGLSEEYYWDKGKLRNPSLLDYRMPTSLDLPMIEAVIVEEPASEGPYGARGVGEVPIVPPPGTLANAIYRATGVRMNRLPMTPERVFWAIKANSEKAKAASKTGIGVR